MTNLFDIELEVQTLTSQFDLKYENTQKTVKIETVIKPQFTFFGDQIIF